MFERFDEDARGAVARARSEAIRTSQAEVGTEQLLVGLASGKGLAAGALGESIRWNYWAAFACLGLAAFFAFNKWA